MGARPLVLLVFLTTTCDRCEPFWEALATAPLGRGQVDAVLVQGSGVRLVVVTPSRSMENEGRALEMLPPGAELVMSSDAWFLYGICQAGTAVLVRDRQDGKPVWEERGEVIGEACPERPSVLGALIKGWLTTSEPAASNNGGG